MYYQVGNKCLEQSQAENLYFSLVVPLIKPDGTILKPEYNGLGWQLSGQTIQANLPACDPLDNFNSGLEIGWLIFGLMASLFFVSLIRSQFK
ncbi:hypothetical protein [Neisseria sp. S1]|uniref:hypothetical protein n=1 Tax=Neisseria sp. S1 TaxID=3318354 RepID=UPI003A8A84E0